MARLLQIEGDVLDLNDDPETAMANRREITRLEDENLSLRRDLEDITAGRDRATRAIRSLQSALGPVYRGLRAIFGDIELAVGEESAASATAPASGHSNSADPRWQNFKDQFPGVPAMIIEALLIHGAMGMTNLSALLKRAYGTTKNAAYKLKSAGAVTIDRGNVSLKR